MLQGCTTPQTCPCSPVSPDALPQSYLHTFAYSNTIYADLWVHLQTVGGGWCSCSIPSPGSGGLPGVMGSHMLREGRRAGQAPCSPCPW